MLTFFYEDFQFFVIQLSKLEQLEKEYENNDTKASEIKRLCIKLAVEKRTDECD